MIARRVEAAGQVQTHGHQARRLEARLHVLQSPEAAQEQAGANQERDREATSVTVRSARRRCRATLPVLPRAVSWSAGGRLVAGRMQRRHEPEDQRGRRADSASPKPERRDRTTPRRAAARPRGRTPRSGGSPRRLRRADAAGVRAAREGAIRVSADERSATVRRRARRESRAPSDERRRAQAGGWRRCRRR